MIPYYFKPSKSQLDSLLNRDLVDDIDVKKVLNLLLVK